MTVGADNAWLGAEIASAGEESNVIEDVSVGTRAHEAAGIAALMVDLMERYFQEHSVLKYI